MVYRCLSAPFTDSLRQDLFDAANAALQAEKSGPDAVLLGQVEATADAAPLDAVVLRPHGITLLVLVPRGGRLSIPALGYGSWLLDGAPLPSPAGFDNPFEQFVQQKQALEVWLGSRLSPEQANLRFITGIVVFAGPVTFSPDVELALNSGTGNGFQLLTNPAELPRRLRQMATPEIELSAADLAEWAASLAPPAPGAAGNSSPEADSEVCDEDSLPETDEPDHAIQPVPNGATDFLTQKARQLWGWLGAADIPDDLPYGYDSAAAVAARSEEKQQLEHTRQQMQADVAAQLQAMEARETERERSIAQLRTELAQAPPVAAEATALVSRLHAETREKAALEAAMQASRAESTARNQELDAKIQQLSQLIERLNAQPAAPAPTPAPASAPMAAPAAEPAGASGQQVPPPTALFTPAVVLEKLKAGTEAGVRQLRAMQQRQPRLALAVGGAAVLALGVWGLGHLGGSQPVPYQKNGRWGFADAKGQPVIPAQFTAAGPFQAGRAVVARDGAYGFVNEAGKEVVAPAYDALNPYAGGYARARVGDAYTFVNEQGEEFDSYYFNARDFAEGHAAVLDHRGWYYIAGPIEPGKPVIFLEAYSFSDGLARVKLADGYTFITADYLDDPSAGTRPFGRYQQAADFADGKARVQKDGRSFLINKDAEEVK
ncbi:WG repeat-containing protein [Hymenobacter terricola]|uniref:WG repeat-containing protein n=1 Tax=Hymenobacter terricola TaxID=2819236 RepID=UPI001B30B63B|nr:WG repeat-containing protein [Hymenobacter terricola]